MFTDLERIEVLGVKDGRGVVWSGLKTLFVSQTKMLVKIKQ